jgi:hypothetical protein
MTLTYRGGYENVAAYVPDYSVVQPTWKRLRKRFGDLSYIIVPEFGGDNRRLHWHAVVSFFDREVTFADLGVEPGTRMDVVEPRRKRGRPAVPWWDEGFVQVDAPSIEGVEYCVHYAQKEATGPDMNYTFVRQSRKPALGDRWLRDEAAKYADARVSVRNFNFFLPPGYGYKKYRLFLPHSRLKLVRYYVEACEERGFEPVLTEKVQRLLEADAKRVEEAEADVRRRAAFEANTPHELLSFDGDGFNDAGVFYYYRNHYYWVTFGYKEDILRCGPGWESAEALRDVGVEYLGEGDGGATTVENRISARLGEFRHNGSNRARDMLNVGLKTLPTVGCVLCGSPWQGFAICSKCRQRQALRIIENRPYLESEVVNDRWFEKTRIHSKKKRAGLAGPRVMKKSSKTLRKGGS